MSTVLSLRNPDIEQNWRIFKYFIKPQLRQEQKNKPVKQAREIQKLHGYTGQVIYDRDPTTVRKRRSFQQIFLGPIGKYLQTCGVRKAF